MEQRIIDIENTLYITQDKFKVVITQPTYVANIGNITEKRETSSIHFKLPKQLNR